MCKAKVEEMSCPTFRTMSVIYEKKVITVDFNRFEISKKIIKILSPDGKEKILFLKIKPVQNSDQAYLDYVQKKCDMLATAQIKAQKKAEKSLSLRRA